MVPLMLLGTFLFFILLDAFLNRKKAPAVAAALQPAPVPIPSDAEVVGGFRVPRNYRYHPGHAWAFEDAASNFRVGMDEFAAALAGNIEKIELPKPGVWVRQGQKCWTITRKGEKTTMVSPIEGEVAEVNHAVLRNPALLRDDPYGQGWLLSVHAPDAANVTKNLLPASLIPQWMRAAVDHLYQLQPQLAGAVAADGGVPARDICEELPNISWKEVTREFFLT
jgi:glycine cleavage system H protein